jgi:hypothetical protein
MFKPFFVHFNRPVRRTDSSRLRHMPRGFTIKVSPGDEPRTIKVQTSFCSARDEFVKAQGREQAEAAPVNIINPRDLPRFVVENQNQCTMQQRFSDASYLYLLKYVV